MKLFLKKKKRNGRNNQGRITVRHRGGGVAFKIKNIDYKRYNFDFLFGVVKNFVYDSRRSCWLALIHYENGEKCFILKTPNMRKNQQVQSSPQALKEIEGNNFPIKYMAVGSLIHNVENRPRSGGVFGRTAGSLVEIIGQGTTFTLIKLKSKRIIRISNNCRATFGSIDIIGSVKYQKAGLNRLRGMRPKVRGSAMNAVDHPHGGGEGKAPIGRRSPLTPWGKPTLGKKTRKKWREKIFIIK